MVTFFILPRLFYSGLLPISLCIVFMNILRFIKIWLNSWSIFYRYIEYSRRLSSKVVMQRIANPSTPVRFRPQPHLICIRGKIYLFKQKYLFVCAWIHILNFSITCNIMNSPCPGGGIGRHKGLKIPRRKLRAGSSPALGTKLLNNENYNS